MFGETQGCEFYPLVFRAWCYHQPAPGGRWTDGTMPHPELGVCAYAGDNMVIRECDYSLRDAGDYLVYWESDNNEVAINLTTPKFYPQEMLREFFYGPCPIVNIESAHVRALGFDEDWTEISTAFREIAGPLTDFHVELPRQQSPSTTMSSALTDRIFDETFKMQIAQLLEVKLDIAVLSGDRPDINFTSTIILNRAAFSFAGLRALVDRTVRDHTQ